MLRKGTLRGIANAVVLIMTASLSLAPAARSAVCECREKACSGPLPLVAEGMTEPDDPIVKLLKEAAARVAVAGGPYLSLSGGGSHGAWGAGVLYGSQLGGTAPRFRVITGVSTGAVMATLVLIEDYAELKNLYTNVQESDVQRDPWPWDAAFGRALYSREPLRKLMECVLHDNPSGSTMSRFELVQQRAAAGRLLFVGTVDMNTGQFCVWDMTCIACKGDHQKYLDVAMASANAPVVGPPVEIDGHLHVDGGVRAQIFMKKIVDSEITQKHNAYFLVNGKLKGGIGQLEPGWDTEGPLPAIVQIADRGVELLEHEALEYALHYYHKRFAKDHVIHLAQTPEGVTLGYKRREFPRDEMGALFRDGCQWGQNMTPWPVWKASAPQFPELPGDFPPKAWQPPTTDCEPVPKRPARLCPTDH